jgi:hypothetical protein
MLWDVVCRRRRPLLSSFCASPGCRAHQDSALRCITHHAGMSNLGLPLGVMRDRDFYSSYQILRVPDGYLSGWEGTRVSTARKTRLVRTLMTVQNCSVKGLPMRLALTTGVVHRSNIRHRRTLPNGKSGARRRPEASYFAQSPDEHGPTLSNQYANANRAWSNGDKRFIKMAPQSAFARAALPQSPLSWAEHDRSLRPVA